MSRARRSAIAAIVVLAVLGLFWPSKRTHLEANTFGTVPGGQRALFELLTDLGLPVSRSYLPPAVLPPQDVVWWIEPTDACTRVVADRGADETADAADDEGAEGGPEGEAVAPAPPADPPAPPDPPASPLWDPAPWLEAGGTGLVFLPTEPYWSLASALDPTLVGTDCTRLGPFLLPERDAPEDDAETDAPDTGEAGAGAEEPEGADGDRGLDPFERWWSGEPDADDDLPVQVVEGDLVGEPRRLQGPRLRRFLGDGGLRVRARVDGAPFVLEKRVGAGRLVVVADGRFLTNAWLDRADAAPLALDLVRAFGVPAFDERSHGLRREQRALVYLAGSPALPVFGGLVALGLLALWRGSALPRRAVAEADPGAPELERFVDSLATLYARSRDHAQVARRYRELSVARLRRRLGLPPETPARAVVERLRGEGRVAPADLSLLEAEDAPVRGAAELRGLARRLDALVKEACR